MTPLLQCSVGNINLYPGTTFIHRRNLQIPKCNASQKQDKWISNIEENVFPYSALHLSKINGFCFVSKRVLRSHIIAAVGTDVPVGDPNPPIYGDVDETKVSSPISDETSENSTENPPSTPTTRSKRPKPIRKSEMPLVKDEELIPGASFIGKVKSIQPFGAFVDFGAFTDGLVHVSRISDDFVKDVGAVVSIGQEVKVKVVDANKETGRISLTMRDGDDSSKTQQRTEGTASRSGDKPRSIRKNSSRSNQKRDEVKKSSKFVKGQSLDGTVKNITRSGSFISLPDGEEGFLPVSEESEGFGSILGNSSLHIGQEVKVRVLRLSRGQATLTMKKEEDVEAMNRQLNQGVVHVATNPFELAFRQNKEISAFLDDRERLLKKNSTIVGEKVDESSALVFENERSTPEVVNEENSAVESISDDQISSDVDHICDSAENAVSSPESSAEDQNRTLAESSSIVSDEDKEVDALNLSILEDESQNSIDEISGDLVASTAEISKTEGVPIANEFEQSSIHTMSFSEDEDKTKSSNAEDVISDEVTFSESLIDNEVPVTAEVEQNELPDFTDSLNNESHEECMEASDVSDEKVPSTQSNFATINGKLDKESAPSLEIKVDNLNTNGAKIEASETPSDKSGIPHQESSIKATISPSLVKQLREETGAGMMDCKKALAKTEGDIDKARDFLRKKGLASADKKASRTTAEGRIGSYIHDSRIGVLVEVNCETDFVSRGDIFQQLVDDLAMQVAACPQVRYLVPEDVPEEIVSKEREIEMQKEDLLVKPEQIRSKIVDGRMNKRLAEFALLEQPYIKNDKMVVKDWVKQTISTVGENIKVKRFIRYNLGEGLEKKNQDFVAEVAAQTQAQSSPSAPKDRSTESKENIEKQPTSPISAALVKQLREETGAGMMDCKKALSETGGDLEKAQEYLRKKGHSSADKKSSRLAAEGRISSYIHDSRIGCLIEVNSETDFVSRNEKFVELVDDLAMQAVACPQVEYVSVEEIPESIVNKEKDIEMQREDLQSKPAQIREKIVQGRISKRLGELALLEQPFIKDDSILVKDLVKQTVASLGENIKVRRFVRYILGET